MPPVANAVDCVHLNIGVGDCSIIIDIDLAGRTANNIVLIDGGYSTYPAVRGPHMAIRRFMTITLPITFKANYPYYEDVTLNVCKFSSIVITHWDGVSNIVIVFE